MLDTNGMEALRARVEAELMNRQDSQSSGPDDTFDDHGTDLPAIPTLRRSHEEMDNPSDALVYSLEEGRAYKKQRNLSVESDADAERFLKSTRPYEHQVMIYLALLQNRDMLRKIVKDMNESYQVPALVKSTAQSYATAAILSPSVRAYRRENFAAMILDTMRTLGVSNLPPKGEPARCDLIQAIIAKQLTERRNHIKTEILKTLGNTHSTKTDIASLAKACTSSSKVKITAAHYIRLAFLRSEAVTWKIDPKADEKGRKLDFWEHIDVKLAELRQAFDTPVALQTAFQMVYEDDIKTYGKANGSYELTSAQDNDDWLIALDQCSAREGVEME
ncbi:hypothetical protein H0H92_002995 [Tricholoma furcatifolium]|nr:hypothetical protein H0H92_002995 [Tricholoma furcatifolium]